MKRIAWLCLMLAMAESAMAQINIGKNGTLKGLVFGDYYWMAKSHNPDLQGNNGFRFRRIYFTYDNQISDSFTTRLRLEMKSEGNFTTNSKLNPVVKDAYLRWSKDNNSIYAGISPTPTFNLIEKVWGYRSVEKSPQDLYNFGSSRDFGLAFRGNIGHEGRLKYHAMLANGSSNGTELNKGKKLLLALSYYITKNFVVQAYGDWNDNTGNTDTYTAQGFAAYVSKSLSVGASYDYQFRNNTETGDLNLELVSLFAHTKLSKGLNAFARVDHLFDAYPNGPANDFIPFGDQATSTFLVGGADLFLNEKVHLIPNIEAVIYGTNSSGVHPDTDLIPRLTLFYTF